MICPRCSSRSVGKVGLGQYYCSECCIEFAVNKYGVRMYEVDAEGELVAIDATPEPVMLQEGGLA